MESVVRGGPWWPGQDRDAAVLAAFGMLLHCALALQPHHGGYRCPALPRCGPASLQRGEVASSHPIHHGWEMPARVLAPEGPAAASLGGVKLGHVCVS